MKLFLPRDLWGQVFLFLIDWWDVLTFRTLDKEMNGIFHKWFWSEYQSMAPNGGMLHLQCDMCEANIDDRKIKGRILNLPWVIFLSPVYKFCNKPECARTVMRNYLEKVEQNGYITVLVPFIDSFCTMKEGNRGFACNKCIKISADGTIKILMYCGDAEHIMPIHVDRKNMKTHIYGPIKFLHFR